METVRIAEIEVTRICLGTGRFGSAISEEDSFRILDRYWELGGRAIDTAHIYAAWLPDGWGKSEITIGRWLRRTGVREDAVIGTKGGHPDVETWEVSRLSAKEIKQDLHESLDRLGLEAVDLYWLHRDDPSVPVPDILDSLNESASAGLIRYCGASNWSVHRLQKAAAYAEERGIAGFCASQVAFSAAQPQANFDRPGTLAVGPETLDYHRSTGFPVFAYSSQAKGFFADRRYERTSVSEKGQTAAAYFSDENFDRLERVRHLAGELAREPNDVALAYLFGQTFPVVAIAGPRSVEQITTTCAGADLVLSPDQVYFVETGKRERS